MCTGEQDIASILDDDNKSNLGNQSVDIEAIICLHSYFDYTGDPSRSPPVVELVVEPGVKDSAWLGYPLNPDGSVLDNNAAG